MSATAAIPVLSRAAKDAILEERARALAVPAKAPGIDMAELRLATFTLAGERYGIEARFVVHVGRLSNCTPLPGAPPFVVGVTNFRGEILPIFDLRELLAISRGALDDLSRIVVLGADRPAFGILADTTSEIVSLPLAELLACPASVTTDARRYLRGVTASTLVVLDGAVLLEDRRLFIDPDDTHSSAPKRST
jgi:purine-binding chemotaxis protein CheW